MRYLWRAKSISENAVDRVKEITGLPRVISKCIALRLGEECGEQDIKAYVKPELDMLHDPFMLEGMEKAVGLIRKTVEEQKKIVIYGDYDVDGITSVSLLVRQFRKMGGQADWYIPNRIEHGYGLNRESVGELADRGFELLITVDCGISAVESVRYARERGMKVIVTDHHEPGDEIPDADAVINPKLGGYPFRDLAGVGVAFKLACAVNGSVCEDLTDLAAVGTVADIVPLLGENRIIVNHGLSHVENEGIRRIAAHAGITRKTLVPGEISFKIAPRINSMGRLDDATEVVRMFVDEDDGFMDGFLDEMEAVNNERRKIADEITSLALETAAGLPWEETGILIMRGKTWHHGVLGISASRITETFFRPALLISESGDGTSRGSGRSIPGLDLLTLLRSSEDLFERLGGHSQAAGFTIRTENIETLSKRLNDLLRKQSPGLFLPWKEYDEVIESSDLDEDFHSGLETMRPFGFANPKPFLRINGVKVSSRPRIYGGKHLSFDTDTSSIRVIGFGKSDYEPLLSPTLDILGQFTKKEYRQREYLELSFSDIMESQSVSRKDLAAAYRFLRQRGSDSYLGNLIGLKRHIPRPGRVMKIFEELGIIVRYGDRMKFHKTGETFNLGESTIYGDGNSEMK